jgi:putative addiction module component (TIGR02574 family)
VQRLAALGEEVFCKDLLDVDQRALAWAVAPVLQCGKEWDQGLRRSSGNQSRKNFSTIQSTAKEDFTMSLTYQQVAQAAMQLTPDERVDLAEKLWVSVDTPEAIAAAWDEEIARRVAQLDAGEVETVPAEQVLAELRARLK